MKKYIFYLSLMALIFVSCDIKDEYIEEDSKAVAFAGDWNYAVYSVDMNTKYKSYDRNRMLTYNTSADLANEIWVDAQAIPLYLNFKFKSNFTGSINSFSSPLSENINYNSALTPSSTPDSVGAVTTLVQYKTCGIVSGKIISKAGVSKTGYPTDSLYLQVEAVQNTMSFVGALSGTDLVWQQQSTVDANVQIVIAGQRVTGFVEDIW